MTYHIFDIPPLKGGQRPSNFDDSDIREKAADGDWILARVGADAWAGCGLFRYADSIKLKGGLIVHWEYGTGDEPPVIVPGATASDVTVGDDIGKQIVRALGERWAGITHLGSRSEHHWKTLHAVRTLSASQGRPVTVAEINDHLVRNRPDYKKKNTQADLSLLSVNDQSRGHHQRRRLHGFLRSDLGNIYDQLFKVSIGNGRVAYEPYDIRKHGVWELIPDQHGHPELVEDSSPCEAADAVMAAVVEEDDHLQPPITSDEDSRKWVYSAIRRRRGQQAFRSQLMTAYGGKCAMTDCRTNEVLEAAHIKPYRGDHTSRVDNGLLLRADVHTLFDLGRVWVDSETMTIRVIESLLDTEYGDLDGKPLRIPADAKSRPRKEHLRDHAKFFGRIRTG